ncbi:MAG: hypothetical protein SNJ72_05525 [Fimbriimonadales bacterium]
MSSVKKLSEEEIQQIWEMIDQYYHNHLAERGVKRINLKDKNDKYTKDALVLVYLARGYPDTRWITKEELTAFIRLYYPNTPDVQQARHLGPQKGYHVLSTVRKNSISSLPKELHGKSCYKLESLETPHPNYIPSRRGAESIDFNNIKQKYGNRCALCGSVEGKPNLRYPNSLTQLQKGHRNPHLGLKANNIIPLCQFCNRADRDWWVYDERGRVVGVASSQPVIRSIEKGYITEEDARRIYEHIKKKLGQEG